MKAVQPIAAGAFVVEYVGEVIDEGMCRDRLQRYHEEGRQSFYILSLAKGLYIDAAAKANKARWAGHAALGGRGMQQQVGEACSADRPGAHVRTFVCVAVLRK